MAAIYVISFIAVIGFCYIWWSFSRYNADRKLLANYLQQFIVSMQSDISYKLTLIGIDSKHDSKGFVETVRRKVEDALRIEREYPKHLIILHELFEVNIELNKALRNPGTIFKMKKEGGDSTCETDTCKAHQAHTELCVNHPHPSYRGCNIRSYCMYSSANSGVHAVIDGNPAVVNISSTELPFAIGVPAWTFTEPAEVRTGA